MNAYLACWKKYAVFTGRSSRNEFWSWFLINLAIGIGFQILFSAIGGGQLTVGEDGQAIMTPITSAGMGVLIVWGLYSLLVILPWIGVSIRRLHDQDKSGVWLLLVFACGIGALVFLVIQVLPGTEGENRFGSQPES
jgi:uncharacterized membrane protein YhaH (DUF805 family)